MANLKSAHADFGMALGMALAAALKPPRCQWGRILPNCSTVQYMDVRSIAASCKDSSSPVQAQTGYVEYLRRQTYPEKKGLWQTRKRKRRHVRLT
jgi:hypothetical protein